MTGTTLFSSGDTIINSVGNDLGSAEIDGGNLFVHEDAMFGGAESEW